MLKDDKYYEIPIEKLGLSVNTINELKRLGCEFVGDCVDWHLRVRDGDFFGHAPTSFYEVMLGEVKEKLIEHGYWEVSPSDFEVGMLEELKQALIKKGYWPNNTG